MSRLIFWEPCCLEWEHAEFNKFLLKAVSSAHTVYAACSSAHLNVISTGLDAPVVHAFDAFDSDQIARRTRVPMWQRWRPLVRQCRAIQRLVRNKQCDTVLVATTDLFTMFFIAALALRSAHTRFYVVLHGLIAHVAADRRRRTAFQACSYLLRRNTTLVTFFEAQTDLIRDVVRHGRCRIASAPLAYRDAPSTRYVSAVATQSPRDTREAPVVVIPGAFVEPKMVISRDTQDPGRAEGLQIVQVVSGQVTADARVPLEMVELTVVPDNGAFRAALGSADAILFLGYPNFYSYAVSGVVWDAFTMNTPLIAVSNSFLREFLFKYDLPILLFEDGDALLRGVVGGNVRDWLVSLRGTDLPARFARFRAVMGEGAATERWLAMLADV